MNNTIFYTPDEVAKILKISRFTVYEMIKRGELKASRIGRKMRIEPEDLDVYINQSKGISKPPESLPVQALPIIQAVRTSPQTETLILCGQDLLLDILTRHLERALPNTQVLRSYKGSLNGLFALYHGTVSMATAHLWDSDTNDYNTPYVRRFLPGQAAILIQLMYRLEGFYVAKGNPKAISTWHDLTRNDIVMINREKGAGVRVLLDEKLRQLKISHQQIQGYHHEELSHLAVASAIARGQADVGIGIEKAAMQVKEIDFIPLQKERYDLVLRKEDLPRPEFQTLLAILKSPEFQAEIAGMGGYDISQIGQIIAEV